MWPFRKKPEPKPELDFVQALTEPEQPAEAPEAREKTGEELWEEQVMSDILDAVERDVDLHPEEWVRDDGRPHMDIIRKRSWPESDMLRMTRGSYVTVWTLDAAIMTTRTVDLERFKAILPKLERAAFCRRKAAMAEFLATAFGDTSNSETGEVK